MTRKPEAISTDIFMTLTVVENHGFKVGDQIRMKLKDSQVRTFTVESVKERELRIKTPKLRRQQFRHFMLSLPETHDWWKGRKR